MPYMIDQEKLKVHLKAILKDAKDDQSCNNCDHEELHQTKEYWDGWHECYNQMLSTIEFFCKCKI